MSTHTHYLWFHPRRGRGLLSPGHRGGFGANPCAHPGGLAARAAVSEAVGASGSLRSWIGWSDGRRQPKRSSARHISRAEHPYERHAGQYDPYHEGTHHQPQAKL